MARVSLAAAVAEVARRDAVLAHLVALVGPVRHRPRSADGHFGALAGAIISQQLSGRAAATILGRVELAAAGHLSAASIAAVPDAELRGAGLSGNKLASLRDLSAKVLRGAVDLEEFRTKSDEEVIADLVAVRGIGRWTAEMYLMFELRRLDIWPVDDLGVRQGYGLAWGLTEPPPAKLLVPLGDPFRPYRSVVARYCWEAVGLYRNGIDPSVDRGPDSPASRAADILARVRAIPEGFVRTYGDIYPNAPRLVGHVLATTTEEVPWHRVVRADGTPAMGRRQMEALRKEGIPMRGERVDLRLARLPAALRDAGR